MKHWKTPIKAPDLLKSHAVCSPEQPAVGARSGCIAALLRAPDKAAVHVRSQSCIIWWEVCTWVCSLLATCKGLFSSQPRLCIIVEQMSSISSFCTCCGSIRCSATSWGGMC